MRLPHLPTQMMRLEVGHIQALRRQGRYGQRQLPEVEASGSWHPPKKHLAMSCFRMRLDKCRVLQMLRLASHLSQICSV